MHGTAIGPLGENFKAAVGVEADAGTAGTRSPQRIPPCPARTRACLPRMVRGVVVCQHQQLQPSVGMGGHGRGAHYPAPQAEPATPTTPGGVLPVVNHRSAAALDEDLKASVGVAADRS